MGYYLEAKNVSKHFGGIRALDKVSFKLNRGEIHCIVGENGAGKSTLGKAFVGIHSIDEGEIIVNGEKVKNITPAVARKLKIAMVAQELNLMQHMTIAENIYMLENDSYKRNLIFDYKGIIQKAEELFQMFDLENFPAVTTRVADLTVGEQQIVEIMKAVAQKNDVLIFDEPTTSLSLSEVERLFVLMRRLRDEENVGMVLVTHKFDEIFSISDFVTVLCDGHIVKERIPTQELDKFELVRLMVGRDFNDFYGQRQELEPGSVVLSVQGLSDGERVNGVDFEVKRKEIVGFAGLVGAGRTEIAETILGLRHATQGSIILNGKDISRLSSKKIIESGLILIPEDRKQKGLFIEQSIEMNIAITGINKSNRLIQNEKTYAKNVEQMIDRLSIKIGSIWDKANSLSGGNQQKVLLAKWLCLESDVIIFDEPTKGIDVGTKVEIYELIRELARAGKAIIVISSDMQEVISITDRILVVNEGKIVAEMKSEEATSNGILEAAINYDESKGRK